jgi:hypothetical protein
MPDEEQAAPTSAANGCDVDWSWIAGREIATVQSDLRSFVLTFRDGQTLAVRAELFQGAPFLSFAPWGAP